MKSTHTPSTKGRRTVDLGIGHKGQLEAAEKLRFVELFVLFGLYDLNIQESAHPRAADERTGTKQEENKAWNTRC